MHARSMFVLAVVLIAFSDLLPSGRQVEDFIWYVERAPLYVAHAVRSDVDSLCRDFDGIRQQALDAPARAQSLWSQIHSDVRVVYADARADARHAAERFTPQTESR